LDIAELVTYANTQYPIPNIQSPFFLKDLIVPDPRRQQGQQGEEIAVRLLQDAGLTIRERNWRCPAGELDIVAEEIAPDYVTGEMATRWLVLVEVRSRRGTRYGPARAAFTHQKQIKLQEVAAHYVQSVAWTGPWRIDAVAVQLDAGGHLIEAEHIRHAVRG
jgi:putative endonuclease